jgi:hypothetical protein
VLEDGSHQEVLIGLHSSDGGPVHAEVTERGEIHKRAAAESSTPEGETDPEQPGDHSNAGSE